MAAGTADRAVGGQTGVKIELFPEFDFLGSSGVVGRVHHGG
jgi:hypothetical protein